MESNKTWSLKVSSEATPTHKMFFPLYDTFHSYFVDLNFIPCQFGLRMQHPRWILSYKGSVLNRKKF